MIMMKGKVEEKELYGKLTLSKLCLFVCECWYTLERFCRVIHSDLDNHMHIYIQPVSIGLPFSLHSLYSFVAPLLRHLPVGP